MSLATKKKISFQRQTRYSMVGNSLKEIQTLEVPVMAKMAEEGFLFMAKKIVATVDR